MQNWSGNKKACTRAAEKKMMFFYTLFCFMY